jgi:hypothetical protein
LEGNWGGGGIVNRKKRKKGRGMKIDYEKREIIGTKDS